MRQHKTVGEVGTGQKEHRSRYEGKQEDGRGTQRGHRRVKEGQASTERSYRTINRQKEMNKEAKTGV